MNRFDLPTDNNCFDIFLEKVIELFEPDLYEINKDYIDSEEFIVYVELLYNKNYTPKMVVQETKTFLYNETKNT